MKILIDMNLSPEWVIVFKQVGWESMHWTEFNDPKAPDEVLMDWAKSAGYLVFTHDLDFGALLSATQATGQVSSNYAVRTPSPALWARQLLQPFKLILKNLQKEH